MEPEMENKTDPPSVPPPPVPKSKTPIIVPILIDIAIGLCLIDTVGVYRLFKAGTGTSQVFGIFILVAFFITILFIFALVYSIRAKKSELILAFSILGGLAVGFLAIISLIMTLCGGMIGG